MFRNYVKVALRNFTRHKIYSAINLGGLTVAVTCCLLIGLYVRHERSYDRFHTKTGRLFRAWTQEEYKGERFANVVTPYILGPTLKETFPEVEAVTRVLTGNVDVRKGNEIFSERIHMVDPAFIGMFDFPLINPASANPLQDLYSVVLTEERARTYFGDQNPVGKTLNIRLDSTMQAFTVTAVAKNIPTNSSIRFDLLIPLAHIKGLRSDKALKSWFNVEPETFVLLQDPKTGEPVNPDKLAAKYPAMLRTVLGDYYKGNNYVINLQPITDIHLNNNLSGGNEPVSNPMYSYILAAVGLFLLVIACINFMTLSLGRSVSRAQEVGVRKAMGALRSQLMNQFWSEALLMTVLAVGLSLVLTVVFLPRFGQLAGQTLQFRFDATTAALLLSLVAIVGLVAGSYPALVLSGFQPVEVLKGKLSLKGDVSFFRRSLVVMQFTLSIILITGTFVLNQQLNYLQNKSLGYQKEQMVVIPVGESGREGRAIVERFRNAAASRNGVIGVASSAFPFASGGWGKMGFTDNQKIYREFQFNAVDPYFLPAYGIKLVKGRNFDPKNSADNFGALIVNEAFVRKFGLKNAVNDRLPGKFPDHRIIGVTEDFHYASLHDKVEPLALMVRFDSLRKGIENINVQSSMQPDVSVRLSPGNLADKVAILQQTWKAVAPNKPFRFTFVDDDLQRQYEAEQRLVRIVTIASGLSILIACLGLFGLATLAVVRRTKEIGVRKVLGASVTSIVSLLASDFLKLVLIATIIATPIAWYAMHRWLQDFAYKIDLTWWVFALAALLVMVVTFVTVSLQSVKAALTNPVKSLRSE